MSGWVGISTVNCPSLEVTVSQVVSALPGTATTPDATATRTRIAESFHIAVILCGEFSKQSARAGDGVSRDGTNCATGSAGANWLYPTACPITTGRPVFRFRVA